ncbi:Endopolyphosphatase [Tilletia horrida]|nr:Endopolyphosphatase [Tilletia horrida]
MKATTTATLLVAAFVAALGPGAGRMPDAAGGHSRGAGVFAASLPPLPSSRSSSRAPWVEHGTLEAPPPRSLGLKSGSEPGQYGKFLHITDLHPDAHYTPGAKVSDACHVSHKKEKQRHGGRFPPPSFSSPESSSGPSDALISSSADSWLSAPLRISLELGSRLGWGRRGRSEERAVGAAAKEDKAGHFGAPDSICDSPPALISASLRWIVDNWLTGSNSSSRAAPDADAGAGLGFDFILVTGDLARHDVDAQQYPRTLSEIYRSNRWTMEQIERAFPAIPIVPCVGNNDIFPHNIMFPGPSDVTRELANIWAKHIPEFEVHNFQRGAYFAKEVVPNELAVLSLNTIYMYDSNKVIDGCVRSKKSKPEKDRDAGTVMLDWMEVQLSLFRSRGMQVHIMGHVPPTPGNYFPLCYERYTEIVLRFQDTVIGQHFGHMNVDAFFVQEDEEAVMSLDTSSHESQQQNGSPSSLSHYNHNDDGLVHTSLLADDLQDDYATLPGRKRTNLDYYHAFFAAPSIVPTFLPTIRVYTYNTTRSAKKGQETRAALDVDALRREIEEREGDEDEENEDEGAGLVHASRRSHRRRHRKHKRKKHRRKKLPRYASPDAPSRTNTYLSMLGYSQWVLDLDRANAEWEKRQAKKGKKGGEVEVGVEFELEYVTYEPETLWAPYLAGTDSGAAAAGDAPVPKALLDRHLARAGVEPPRYEVRGDKQKISLRMVGCAFRQALASRLFPTSVPASCAAKAHRTKHKHQHKHKLRLPKAIKHLTDYGMGSLTVEPMMELARRLASDKKLWKRFTGRMYQGLSGVLAYPKPWIT